MRQRFAFISILLIALLSAIGPGCGGTQDNQQTTGNGSPVSSNVTQKSGTTTTGEDVNPTDTGSDVTPQTGSTGSTGSTGGVVPPLNAIPPKVTTSTPADAATNVPIGTPLTVTFDRPMESSTVLYRMRLRGSLDNAIWHSVIGNASTSDNTTFTFTPSSPLKKNAYYQLIVDVGAWDKHGVSTDHTFKANFTSEYGAPSVTSVDPANGDYTGTSPTITITFDSDMEDTTVYPNITLLQGGTTVSCYKNKVDDHTYYLTPNAYLTGSTTYNVKVDTGAKSIHNMPLSSTFTSMFKTF